MKYWLFDGEDIIGPFAPYEIAERTGFSPDTLVCPEPDSEKENAWKPAAAFDDFNAENIQKGKTDALAAAETKQEETADEKNVEVPAQAITPSPEKKPQTPAPASVPISQVTPDEEPLFSDQQTETKPTETTTVEESVAEKEAVAETGKEEEETPSTHELPMLGEAQLPTVAKETKTAQLPSLAEMENGALTTEEETENLAAESTDENDEKIDELLTPAADEPQTDDDRENAAPLTDKTVKPAPQETTQPVQEQPQAEVPTAEPAQEQLPATQPVQEQDVQEQSSAEKPQKTDFKKSPEKGSKTLVKAALAACIILLLLLAGCVAVLFKREQKPSPVLTPAHAETVVTETAKPLTVTPQKTSDAPQKTAEKQPAPQTLPSTPKVEIPVNIPVPPPPKQTVSPLQEKAINIVKNHLLADKNLTVEAYLAQIYNHQLSQGYTGDWSAELLHKNTYIVKYRLTKTRVEPVVYVFQADTQQEKLTGALNNITLDLIGKN